MKSVNELCPWFSNELCSWFTKLFNGVVWLTTSETRLQIRRFEQL